MELKGKILLKEEQDLTINPCQEIILNNIVNFTKVFTTSEVEAMLHAMQVTEWKHPDVEDFMHIAKETGNIIYSENDDFRED